ncbi:MAG: hypothetical protein HOO96_15365 [Polyangiaceae bacterium]|nr:hypothetical protein [Polyangiaceae bacterium]
MSEAGSKEEAAQAETNIQTFLQEVRTVLPGTQLLGAFLLTVPFQARYETLAPSERIVLFVTFIANLVALAAFLLPAVYHRVAAPMREKNKFVVLGTWVVLAGFVPLFVSTILTVHVLASMVFPDSSIPLVTSLVLGLLLFFGWAVVPMLRLHERIGARRSGLK